jgi:hypothetical protein
MFNLPVEYNKLKPNEKKLVREQYVNQQGGMCQYCKHLLSEPPPEKIKEKEINWKLFPPNFLKYPIHLHHDHQTGLTIGAVHSLCNAVLWQYEGQ